MVPATETNQHSRSDKEEDEHELFCDAQAWGDGANSSVGSGQSAKLLKKILQDRNKRVVKISHEAKHGDGRASGAGEHASAYNDTKLSRTQPWRLRYPTPHDLKEHLSRTSASDDGA